MRTLRLLLAASVVCLLAVPASATAKSRDVNGDRIPDRWERKHHLSLRVNQADRDQDRDGLVNLGEYRSHTDPRDKDTDGDGTEDGDEDRDRDRVDNANEVRERTHASRRDTDRDGRNDGREDADRDNLDNAGEDRSGMDPIDPDSDDDGIEDGDENAGMILSFQSGVLTIDLANGGVVSGKVSEETAIECVSEEERELEHESDEEEGADEEGENGDQEDAESLGDDSESDDGENDGVLFGSDDIGGADEHPDSSELGDGDGLDEPEDGEALDDQELDDGDHACATADLVPGTVVGEAELEATAEGLLFVAIELLK